MAIELKKAQPVQPAKAASTAQTDVAQSSGTAPVQPSTEEKNKLLEEKEKELKSGFSRLGNKEKELAEREAKIANVLNSQPDLLAKAQKLEQLEKMLEADPYAVVKTRGNPSDTQTKILQGLMSDRPEVQVVQSLTKTVETLTKKLEAIEKAKTNEEEAKRQQEFVASLEKIADSKNAKIVRNSKSWQAVVNTFNKLKAEAKDGEEVDYEKALEVTETTLKTEIKNLFKSGAFSKEEALSWFEAELVKEAEVLEEKPAIPKKVSSGAPKKEEAPVKPPAPSGVERPRTLAEARRRGPQFFKELMEKNNKKTG